MTIRKNDNVKRGEIYFANLNPYIGSEQGGVRPVLIIQNDVGNKYSPTVIICSITTQMKKSKVPTHVEIKANKNYGLCEDSIILLEQIKTIDKKRLLHKAGELDDLTLKKVNDAIKISLNIN